MRRGSTIQSGRMFFYGDSSYRANYLCVTLKQPVRPDVLQRAVERALESQPWACYGVEEVSGAFCYHDDLERTIRVSELSADTLPELGGSCANGHLVGVSYRDRSIYFSFFHGLTDGGGETMLTHEVLGWYAHEVLGVPYEGAPPAPDMDAEPFEVLDDALARAGLADAQIDGMGSLGEEFLVEEELRPCATVGGRHFIVHMDTTGFMAFARREHVKASAALCALYAAAVQRVHPNNTKPVRIALPTNMRSALGIPGTHRNAVMPPVMLEVGGCAKLSLHELAQSLNHLILERASDSAKLLAMRDMRDMEASMPAMPFAQMEQLLATYRGDDAHYTFNCSYVHRYTDEPFLELVEDASTIVHSYVGCTALLAMALPEHFTISLNQGGDTRAYVDAFVELLNAEGIEASIVGEATVRGAYVALRESLGLKAGNVL